MSWERFTFCADLHGDRQDAEAVDAFFSHDKIWKPKIRVFGGDLVDLSGSRRSKRWPKKKVLTEKEIVVYGLYAELRGLLLWSAAPWLRLSQGAAFVYGRLS